MRRTFKRNRPTYKCCECGRLTRDTGRGEGPHEICARCFEIDGLENAVADYNLPEDAAKLAALKDVRGY